MDYAYLVPGWLVGTVGKSAADEAIKATTDVVLRWMRSRRKPARYQLVELLGPDGSCSRSSRCQSQTELRGGSSRRRDRGMRKPAGDDAA